MRLGRVALTDDKVAGAEHPSEKPFAEVKITGVNVDLKGLEKYTGVLKNALRALSRGIGTWYEPIGRTRDANADREVALTRVQTLIDRKRKEIEFTKLEQELNDQISVQPTIEDRAISYVIEEATEEQNNREKVVDAVVLEFKRSPPDSDAEREIDDDWLVKFWSMAAKISREEVQLFLARLLVKEVSQPGAISPLTLRVLSTMTAIVAQRFEHFCRLSIRHNRDVYVIHPNVFSFQKIGPLDALE
jgi:Protein of unknown function (DUF2806)